MGQGAVGEPAGKLREAARDLYKPKPSKEEAARYGLTVEEASGPPVPLWPDNVQAVNVFAAVATQWRVGAAGATGLDYTPLPAVMQFAGIPEADHAQLFEDLRVMEAAALAQIRAK